MSVQEKIYEEAPDEWLRGNYPQPNLFDPPFVATSRTSKDAATSISAKTPSLRKRVLEALQICGPMTDQELAEWFQLSENTIRPRRVELSKVNAIVQQGTKLTKSGRSAVIWGVA